MCDCRLTTSTGYFLPSYLLLWRHWLSVLVAAQVSDTGLCVLVLSLVLVRSYVCGSRKHGSFFPLVMPVKSNAYYITAHVTSSGTLIVNWASLMSGSLVGVTLVHVNLHCSFPLHTNQFIRKRNVQRVDKRYQHSLIWVYLCIALCVTSLGVTLLLPEVPCYACRRLETRV